MMQQLIDKKFLFVTGKGGVGKSTIAGALAVLAASQGRRVLLCDVDRSHGFANLLPSKPLTFEPQQIANNVFAMTMDTERSLEEYLRLNLRIPFLGRAKSLAPIFDFVSTAAPGVREILVIGKLTFEVREKNYDLVIADAPATGHALGQLDAVTAIHNLVPVGPLRSQTSWMLDILRDPSQSGLVAVTTPEELSVSETLALATRVQEGDSIELAAVILNRMPELRFTTAQRKLLAKVGIIESDSSEGAVLNFALNAANENAVRQDRAAEQASILRNALAATVPIINIAETNSDMQLVDTIVELLQSGLRDE